jgi:hypothetical protein
MSKDSSIFILPDNMYFEDRGTIFIREYEVDYPKAIKLIACDCGAVATYGKEAPSRCHANWCATKESK